MTEPAPLFGVARAQVPARLLDLSESGARLSLQAELVVGEEHDFALDLEGQTLRVRARVCRSESTGPGDGFHVGVEFVQLDPAHERLLKQYVSGSGREAEA
jgi:c-di-GMP-binding flagellar brake protein YcgR